MARVQTQDMATSILIILNIVMSVLAFGAVAFGVIVGRTLRPGTSRGEGRASGRGHVAVSQRGYLRTASAATATNSSAR
jgi:hypothetical protein